MVGIERPISHLNTERECPQWVYLLNGKFCLPPSQSHPISAQPELVEGPVKPLFWAMAFYAYLLRCSDGSYYAGHTDDLEHRMSQHASGACGGYTAKRRPVDLVWSEDFPSREDAFWVERQIKGWSRAKKEALIAGDWDLISRLSRGLRNFADDGAGPSTSSG